MSASVRSCELWQFDQIFFQNCFLVRVVTDVSGFPAYLGFAVNGVICSSPWFIVSSSALPRKFHLCERTAHQRAYSGTSQPSSRSLQSWRVESVTQRQDPTFPPRSFRAPYSRAAAATILRHVEECNRVLIHVGLALRPDEAGSALRVGIVEEVGSGCPWNSADPQGPEATALNLMAVLLQTHKCITAVDINESVRWSAPVLASLRKNRAVKRVRVSVGSIDSYKGDSGLFRTITNLGHLEELVFSDKCSETSAHMSPYRSSLLDRGKRHLTRLDVADLTFRKADAKRFIRALMRNASIADLTVGSTVFTCGRGSEDTGTCFAKYLLKPVASLRKLTLKAAWAPTERVLRTLISALAQMRTLLDFSADFCLHAECCAQRIGLFSVLINGALRRLRLPSIACSCDDTPPLHWPVHPADPDAAVELQKLAEALKKHCALQELVLDLRPFGERECHDLFAAVATSHSMRSLSLLHPPVTGSSSRLWDALCALGMKQRVSVEDIHVSPLDIGTLPPLRLNVITIKSAHFIHPLQPGPEQLHEAFETLRLASRVKSLQVHCVGFEVSSYDVLAAFIRGSQALTELSVKLPPSPSELTQELREHASAKLVTAIAHSVSVVSVTLEEVRLALEASKELVKTALKRLVQLTISPDFGLSKDFIRELAAGSAGHFSLLKAQLHGCREHIADLAVIQGAALRNEALIKDAAWFILKGNSGDDCSGARAIELVHHHPRLLELVMEGASVDIARARDMVRSSLAAVGRCSLEEFMRLAGVVRQGVQCTDDPCARLQLTDIGEHCWWHIKQHVRLSDVAWR
ncbi:hypothetical protein MTO96_034619 [Rhipicephalus appendiculatus]